MTSSLPSKMITDREQSAIAVEFAVHRHGGKAAAALAPLLSAELREGETLPDLDLFFQLLARRLSRVREQMVDADEANRQERSGDVDPRRRRDDAAVLLADRLRAVRQHLDSVLGVGRSAALLSLGGEISVRPTVARRQAKQAIRQLRTVEAPALQAARLPELAVDPERLLAMLEPAEAALAEAMESVVRDRKDAQSTQSDKTAARKVYDLAFGQVARALEAFFAMAGLFDLAAQVRPSIRRPGRTDGGETEDPSTPGEGTGEAPAEPAPTPGPTLPIV